jgi:hypothetical protein
VTARVQLVTASFSLGREKCETIVYLELHQSIALEKLGYDVGSIKVCLGYFEILLGMLCLYVNWLYFFVFIFVWKTGTELLYLFSNVYGKVWEFNERGGGYAAPLVFVLLLLYAKTFAKPHPVRPPWEGNPRLR